MHVGSGHNGMGEPLEDAASEEDGVTEDRMDESRDDDGGEVFCGRPMCLEHTVCPQCKVIGASSSAD